MQITIPVRKAGRSINVDTAKLMHTAPLGIQSLEAWVQSVDAALLASKPLMYALTYGLTQTLNDAHANETKKSGSSPDTIMAAVEKKLAALYDGSIKVKGSGAAAIDPVTREALKLAKAQWKSLGEAKQQATIGKARAAYFDESADDETVVNAILKKLAEKPELIEKAEAIVAANQKKVEVDIDLDDLMADDEAEETEETGE